MRYLLIFLLLFGVARAQSVKKSESSVIKLDQVEVNSKIKARYLTCQVGDSTAATYEPSLNITAWGDECRFSVDLGSDPSCDLSGVSPSTGLANGADKITLANGHVSHEVYRRKDGNLEWEIVLDTAPDTNVFTYDIETKGLEFWYQPELTKEQVDDGWERPDSVVGSYAVYHSSKSNNRRWVDGIDTTYYDYKTGKAFHILRPVMFDALSDSAWCDLDIDTETGKLKIMLRQGYLDSAVYPVTIDPTIGKTGTGLSNSPYAECDIKANFDDGDLGSPDYDATLDSGYIYCTNWMPPFYDADSTGIMSVMCYRKKGAGCSTPDVDLVDYTVDIEITNTAAAWNAGVMSGRNNIYADSNYVIAFQGTMRVDSLFALQALRYYYDALLGKDRKYIDSSNTTGCGVGSLSAPADLTDCATTTSCVSMYVTYIFESASSFPADFDYRVQIVIDYTKVSTDETNFPVLLTEVNFPSAIFDADGSYPAQADGGDLRFSSDSAGANRLACDIVTWTTDNDPANGVAQIWVEMANISSANAAHDTIWCWWKTSGADVQPPINAPYGSEDAWSNSFLFVSHMEEASGTLVDETSNSHDFTVTGSPTFQSTGKIGYGILYDASTEKHLMSYKAAMQDLDVGITVMAWYRPTATAGDDWGRIMSFSAGTGSDLWHMGVTDGDYQAARLKDGNNATQTLADSDAPTMTHDTYYHLTFTHSSSTMRLYRDGVLDTTKSTNAGMGTQTDVDSLGIGGHARSSTRGIKGQADEISVSSGARSAGWITTVYNNQSAPTTFAIEGTPVYRGDAAAAGRVIIIQ